MHAIRTCFDRAVAAKLAVSFVDREIRTFGRRMGR